MNPYEILGVAAGATAAECKTAFHKLAKTCHPDLHPNDAAAEARFKEINAAYEAIANPRPEQQQPNWNNNFDPFSVFNDIFKGQFRQQPQQTYHVVITLEEAFSGKEVTLQVGSGIRDLKLAIPPGTEDGLRLVLQGAGPRIHQNLPPCDIVVVIGIRPHQRFSRQGGNLLTMIPVTAFDVLLCNDIEVIDIAGQAIRVSIPENFDTSRKLRLAGQGMPTHQGIRGDLLVELYVQFPPIPSEHLETIRRIAAATSK